MDWGRIGKGKVEIPGFEDPGFVTDARPADESPRRQRFDPEAGRRVRFRRRAIAFVLGSVFVAGSLAALFGSGGYVELRRQDRENAKLEAEVRAARIRVAQLTAHVKGLESDPTYRERVAREQLGLVKPGEFSILLPRDESP